MSKCPYCKAILPQVASFHCEASLYACPNCLNPCTAQRDVYGIACRPLDGFVDVRHTAPPRSAAAKVLSHLGAATENLPVLPEIPQRVMAIAHDPLSSLSDVAAVINEDAGIVLKVLKLANSAFYAGAHEIKNLDTACSRLGMKMIVRMVHAITSGHVYRSGDKTMRDLMRQTWRHALATAYCAGEIGARVSGLSMNEMFLAGLIHDIGRVMLLDIWTGRYGLIGGTISTFRHIAETYHPLAGLHAIQRWDLGTEFRVTTLCHDVPETVPFEEWRKMTYAVALAGAMAVSLGYGPNPSVTTEDHLAGHPAAAVLGLTDEDVAQMASSFVEPIAALADVLAA